VFRHRRSWTDAEIKFLQENRPTHTRAWLAEQLGRTPEAIKRKITELQTLKFKRRVMKRRADAETVPTGFKVCRECARTLPVEQFHRHSNAKDGLQNRCKQCAVALAVRWSKAHPERFSYNQRTARLRAKYGLSRAQLAALLERQNGRCPICQRELNTRFHIDHDHASGKVRGILCDACNKGLGHFGDSSGLLRAALAYLTKPPNGI